MIEKDLNDLKGMDLQWALAVYASEKKIANLGPMGLGVITGEKIVVEGKNGDSDRRISEIRPYSDEDHFEILKSFDLDFVEEGIDFIYSVEGVGKFKSVLQSDAKARAIIATCTGKSSILFPQ
ncbi:hypothetical protein [Pseudomonas sp. S3_B08]